MVTVALLLSCIALPLAAISLFVSIYLYFEIDRIASGS